jgi:hypothetical protein
MTPKIAFTLALTGALVYGQAVGLAGEWRNGAGVVYTFTDSAVPPVAIALKDLGYSCSFNPTTMMVQTAMPFFGKPDGLGFLQHTVGRHFEDELSLSGCWEHLSLEESEDGTTLSGWARINVKRSTRECRRDLTKEAKQGAPFKFALTR